MAWRPSGVSFAALVAAAPAVSAIDFLPESIRGAVLEGDHAGDVKAYLDRALSEADVVYLSRGVYLLSATLSIPTGKTLFADPGAGATLKLMTSSTSQQVVALQSNARLQGVVVDGNLDARETAGTITDYVFGVLWQDVSGAIAEDITYQDVGCTDAEFTANGGNGGGLFMEITTAATTDMRDNRALRCHGSVPKAGFHARIKSPFTATGFGVNSYFITANRIDGLVGEGCRKNAIEIVGPNTRGNVISNCVIIDCTGQGGIEADFGAHLNHFVACKMYFSPTFQLLRSHDCFSQRRSNNTDGARSFGNAFVDCQVEFLGELTGAFNLSGFVEAGQSSDVQFIRPMMYGASLNGQFRKAVGATGTVAGYLQQANFGGNHNTLISGARFYNVDRGIKLFSSSGADLVVVRDSHLFCRGAWYENASSGTIARVHFTGDSYLQTISGSGETGSGTTTALDYGADVRTQTSATSPVA